MIIQTSGSALWWPFVRITYLLIVTKEALQLRSFSLPHLYLFIMLMSQRVLESAHYWRLTFHIGNKRWICWADFHHLRDSGYFPLSLCWQLLLWRIGTENGQLGALFRRGSRLQNQIISVKGAILLLSLFNLLGLGSISMLHGPFWRCIDFLSCTVWALTVPIQR